MQNKKTIVLIRKLQNILPRSALMILYKVFIRPHFDYRKLCSFYKMYKNKNPRYLFNIIATKIPPYIARNDANIPLFKTNHNFSKDSFFHLLLLNGIIKTLIWEIHIPKKLLKTPY